MTEVVEEDDEAIWAPAAQTQGQDWADLEEEEGEGAAVALTEEWGRLFEGKVEWADVISDEEERSDDDNDHYEHHHHEEEFGQVRILKRTTDTNYYQTTNLSPPRHGVRQQKNNHISPPSSSSKASKKKTKNASKKMQQQHSQQPSPQRNHSPHDKRGAKGRSPDHQNNNNAGGSVWRQVGQRATPSSSPAAALEGKIKSPSRALFQDNTPSSSVSGCFESIHPSLLERLKRMGHTIRPSVYLSKAIPQLLARKQFVSLGQDRDREKAGKIPLTFNIAT